jgi:hypothetical protein
MKKSNTNMRTRMTTGITRIPTIRRRPALTIIATAICRCGIPIRMCPMNTTGTVTDRDLRVQSPH